MNERVLASLVKVAKCIPGPEYADFSKHYGSLSKEAKAAYALCVGRKAGVVRKSALFGDNGVSRDTLKQLRDSGWAVQYRFKCSKTCELMVKDWYGTRVCTNQEKVDEVLDLFLGMVKLKELKVAYERLGSQKKLQLKSEFKGLAKSSDVYLKHVVSVFDDALLVLKRLEMWQELQRFVTFVAPVRVSYSPPADTQKNVLANAYFRQFLFFALKDEHWMDQRIGFAFSSLRLWQLYDEALLEEMVSESIWLSLSKNKKMKKQKSKNSNFSKSQSEKTLIGICKKAKAYMIDADLTCRKRTCVNLLTPPPDTHTCPRYYPCNPHDPGRVYARLLWHVLDFFPVNQEFQKDSKEQKMEFLGTQSDILQLLLKSPFLAWRRGKVWNKLALIQHSCPSQCRSTCEMALKDPTVMGSDRLSLAMRAQKQSKFGTPHWARPWVFPPPKDCSFVEWRFSGLFLTQGVVGKKSVFVRKSLRASCKIDELELEKPVVVLESSEQISSLEANDGVSVEQLVGEWFGLHGWKWRHDEGHALMSLYRTMCTDHWRTWSSDSEYDSPCWRTKYKEEYTKWLEPSNLKKLWENQGFSGEFIAAMVDILGFSWLSRVFHVITTSYHHWHSGHPDLLCVNPKMRRVAFVEVKGPRDTLSYKQMAWLQHLASDKSETCLVGVARVAVANP